MQMTDTDYKGLLGRAAPNFGCGITNRKSVRVQN